MSSLPTSPYEVKDFAGGLTENFIGGGPTRYMSGDNFLVTVDRKLEERYGSDLIDTTNFQVPSGNAFINSLALHDNETYLMAVTGPNIYVLNPNWASLLGPTGNPPLAGGTPQGNVTWSEWSHHTVFCNDSLATKPVKVFRGAAYPTTLTAAPSNLTPFMCLTAGLPALSGSQNLNNGAVLQACITLANDLRGKMLSHFADAGLTFNVQLHASVDTVGTAFINAAPSATDQTSLFALVGALISAYQEHAQDAANMAAGAQVWHNAAFGIPNAMTFFLANTTTPTDLITAAGILDDLKTKFFMHQMAIETHDSNANYAILARYLVTAPHIGTISSAPVLSYSIATSLAMVNALKLAINSHLLDANYHTQLDTTNGITFPNAIDLDTLYILIVHCRFHWANHAKDPFSETDNVTMTIVSSAITAAVYTANSITYSSPASGMTIYDPANSMFTLAQQPVTVSGFISAGSGTSSKAANANKTTYPVTITQALYHIGQTTNAATEFFGQTANLAGLLAAVTTSYTPNLSNLQNWISLLTNCVSTFNAHDADAVIHRTSALHAVTAATPVVGSYAYAFHYYYRYMRYDGVIFEVVGPPTLVGPQQTEAITPAYTSTSVSGVSTVQTASPISITNIPVLQNGGGDNYDTANVQIKIFRTINAGTTYYQDTIVSNGTTTYSDTLIDISNSSLPNVVPLNQQVPIYTSGGVINFDPAPVSKYVHIFQNTAYYGAIVDTGQTFLNRIRQSITNNVDSSPGSFFLDLPDVLTGISSTRNNLIALCKNSTYQVQGLFNTLGQGQMSYQSISDTIGCVCVESIVRTDVGIFFAGTDGFYYTDGYQLIKLSSELNLTYASLTTNDKQKNAIYGCYDRYTRRVWWSTQPQASDWSATQSYIFHVNFGVTQNGVFTTASNFENYRPSSMVFWKGTQYRADARGYVFVHSSLKKTDPKVNINATATSWNTVYIPYNYSSCSVDFGTTFQRKWTTRIVMQGKNVGNVGAQITSVSDNGRVPRGALSPILFKPNIMWGQPNIIWGASNALQPITWGDAREMDMMRRFPATQLRSDYKQIIVTPAKVGVYRYEDWPVGALATIVPGVGIASIQIITPAGYTSITWPLDVVGYVFAQQGDGFIAEYAITGVSGSILTVTDTAGALKATTVSWIIRGIMKQQRLSITGYNIHFTLLGKNQQAYQGASNAGENV